MVLTGVLVGLLVQSCSSQQFSGDQRLFSKHCHRTGVAQGVGAGGSALSEVRVTALSPFVLLVGQIIHQREKMQSECLFWVEIIRELWNGLSWEGP